MEIWKAWHSKYFQINGSPTEVKVHDCTKGYNTALLWCRTRRAAHWFFDSDGLALDILSADLVSVEADQALTAITLWQSLATCPTLPQNMQRFCSKRRWCSCWVSLPSFPSFEERSEDFLVDPELLLDEEPDLPEEPELPELPDLPELLEDFFLSLLLFDKLLFLELLLPELLLEFEDLPLSDKQLWTFASRICLVHHSQYQLSMVCVQFRSPESVSGLPMWTNLSLIRARSLM